MAAADINPAISVVLAIVAILLNFRLFTNLVKGIFLNASEPQVQAPCNDRSLPIDHYSPKSLEVLDYIRNILQPRNPMISLSVIIIAYNDESSLKRVLGKCFDYLENRCKCQIGFRYEVIIVDNFSSDRTNEIARNYDSIYGREKCKVVLLSRHRDIESAVYFGTMCAHGEYVLCSDADGTTKFSNITKLEKRLLSLVATNPKSFVVGMSLWKCVGRFVLKFYLRHFIDVPVIPEKCGFTLFTLQATKALFPVTRNEFQTFDENLLTLASLKPDIICDKILLSD